MKCPEVRENLAAYLDGEVDGAPRQAMDAHFAGCPACAAERSAQAAAWRLLDLVEAPAAPPGFEGRVAALARAEGPPGGRILGLTRPAAAAAAAAVVLAVGGGALLLARGGAPSAPGEGGEPAPAPALAAAPPEALLEDLSLLEALDVLEDADLDVLDRISEMEDEDLAVLGG